MLYFSNKNPPNIVIKFIPLSRFLCLFSLTSKPSEGMEDRVLWYYNKSLGLKFFLWVIILSPKMPEW